MGGRPAVHWARYHQLSLATPHVPGSLLCLWTAALNACAVSTMSPWRGQHLKLEDVNFIPVSYGLSCGTLGQLSHL